MIKEAIVKIVGKQDLTHEEAYAVMNEIMSGETTLTQNAAFLAALSTKSAKAEVERALASGAAIIGVNNRNLKDFTVDTANSRRQVTPEAALRLRQLLDPAIPAVGVFVDETPEQVANLLNRGVIQIAQLHGHEDEAYLARIRALAPGRPLWQAFRLHRPEDAAPANASSAEAILLDSGRGSGEAFDWALLAAIRPPVLSGGRPWARNRHRRAERPAPLRGGREQRHRDRSQKRCSKNGGLRGRREKRRCPTGPSASSPPAPKSGWT